MNKEKIIGFLKGTKGKIAMALVGGIVLGSIAGGATTEQVDAVKKVDDLTKQVETLKTENGTLTSKNDELTKKVDEAKPFFQMEESKREAAAEKAKAEQEKLDKEKAKKAEAEAKAALEAKSKVLENGNFVAGKDFDAGTYDIIAVSGGGNVSSSNIYNGGINAVMGSTAKIKESEAIGMKDFYKNEYKNIKLPEGTTLKVDGVKIKLVPQS